VGGSGKRSGVMANSIKGELFLLDSRLQRVETGMARSSGGSGGIVLVVVHAPK
jgi:hypothetical protein